MYGYDKADVLLQPEREGLWCAVGDLISGCCYCYEYQVVLFGCECLVVFYVFIGMNFVKNGIGKCLFAGGCMVFKIEKFVL